MLTVSQIEEYFKDEDYEGAKRVIKQELQRDSYNAELFYYLFLAENGDYSNMDLSNIQSEIDFNKAIDLSNLRLKASFQAEYNFYKAVDKDIRKYFSYAMRDNLDAFVNQLNNYGVKKVELINDSSSVFDFMSNLDFLVTSRVKHSIVDMNLLALNILYLATNNEGVKNIFDVLKERASSIGTKLCNMLIATNITDLKKYVFMLVGKTTTIKDNTSSSVYSRVESESTRKEIFNTTTKTVSKPTIDESASIDRVIRPIRSIQLVVGPIYILLKTLSFILVYIRKHSNTYLSYDANTFHTLYVMSFLFFWICMVLGVIGIIGLASNNRKKNGSRTIIIWAIIMIIIECMTYDYIYFPSI